MESFRGLLLHNELRHNLRHRAAYSLCRLLVPCLWIISTPVAGKPETLLAERAQFNRITAPRAPQAARQSQGIELLQTASVHPQSVPQPFIPLSTRLDPVQARDAAAQLFHSPKPAVRSASRKRRRLAGPGSAPPNCVSRCDECTPCNPVCVPVQPGRKTVGLMEYYPEAWRCKCKNKLFMP